MFRSKAVKPKAASNTSSDIWAGGKENALEQVELIKETPWVPGSKSSGKRLRPRTSSLSQIDDSPDAATTAIEKHAMNRAFERMLDDLQIPPATRSKLFSLEAPVKAAMLKSSQALGLDATVAPPHRQLRKSHSGTSLGSPRPGHGRAQTMYEDIPFELIDPPSLSSLSDSPSDLVSKVSSPWMRHEYATSASSLGRASSPVETASASSSLSAQRGAGKEKANKEKEKDLSAAKFASMLMTTKCTNLDIDRLKKLRLMLRNESAGWTELFIRARGYSALLNCLSDLLNVEWREEQRDDKILHELLRCLKALSTSSIGCVALRSSCPTPWNPLMVLLYSDKKPGDLNTRQEIIDLLHILFELFPSTSPKVARRLSGTPPAAGLPRPGSNISASPVSLYPLPAPYTSVFSLIRSLLLTTAPPPAELPHIPVKPHSFIESLHTPRIYKTYLQELSDLCRDYFWVYCHPTNTIWSLKDTDIARVEQPRAPGGMTGGVEYEAVGYMTSHLRFINTLARAALELNSPVADDLSPNKFHADLFASGFERILATTRKASTIYYPTLHLEIARYISLAYEARFDIPWSLARFIGLPPSTILKADGIAGSARGAKITVSGPQTPPGSPSKPRSGVQGSPRLMQVAVSGPQLPHIKPISPMK